MIIFKPKTYSNKFLPINKNNLFIHESNYPVSTVRKIKHLFGPFYKTMNTVFLDKNFIPTQDLINPNPLLKLNIEIDYLQMEIDHVKALFDYECPIVTDRQRELKFLLKQREQMLA